MYRLTLPHSDTHSQTKIVMSYPGASVEMTFDDSHKTVEIDEPVGVDFDKEVEITAYFCAKNGAPDPSMSAMLMKEKVAHEEPSKPHDETPPAGPTDGIDANADIGLGVTGSEGASTEPEVREASVEQNTNAEVKAESDVTEAKEPEVKNGRRRS